MDIAGISLPLAIGTLFFLLLLSAFFSGSETALTRARRAKLRVRREQGDQGAQKAEELLEQPERMLSTILLGNNFVNIAASALATALFVAKFGEAGIVYATIAMTAVVLIFAEILPKTIAVAHAESIACKVASPMRSTQNLLAPLVSMLLSVIAMLKRILRVPEQADTPLTHKELASMIDMSAESGVLDQAREQMLNNSLTLHEVAVKALMTPRKSMRLLDGSLSVAESLRKVTKSPHSRYPVYLDEPDNLIGIVHLRDLLKLKAPAMRLCDSLIWKNPPYIPASKNALAQLFEFQANHQHMAIIVDEFGDIEGLVTLEDIIEEIVGEIHDESDVPPQLDMWPQPDGSLVTSATVALHDINQEIDANLPEESATTIGGLIVHILGDVPEGRLCMSLGNMRVEVLSIKSARIHRVRLIPIHDDT
ncbi:putative hemolysin [Mariprofundus micogutta]|uniref:Putative hemolysin n=1 Tax=Mariprofundus micogutta TaxID=1921010 RepID=A0A1L8CPA7_9PROT|nr:CNNM domain-containing protein [Mariprofundus micogutta]GAV20756.1 putative hemolysin [Mariprofundus micogutta]